nr:ScbA/BarX family gamma-butyrolactone biosynthesis protein [Kitasatospora sp. NBC_01266]
MTLTTTVPKEFVHRAAVAEVMLTDWQRQDDTHFTVRAQWPRSHSFFTPIEGGYHDPLIVAETIRQAATLLAHTELGVPLGHKFLMWDIKLTVNPDQLQVGNTPASLDIDVSCTELQWRRANLAGFRCEMFMRRDGQLVATGGGSVTCASPAVYRRVRGDHGGHQNPLPLTAPAAPQNVGRMSPMDVVLSPSGEPNRWQLRVDTQHPVLFDHPQDHVPGMVLLEAARQATAAALNCSSLLPLSIVGDFQRYVELDAPCVIEATRLSCAATTGEDTVVVTGHQEGAAVFSATVTALRRSA